MSQAYRIRVKESLGRVIRAADRVSTRLEILEVLPPEQMAGLLGEALEQRGYARQGNILVRRQKDVTVTVDAASGTVTVAAELSEKAHVEGERDGQVYDDVGPHAKTVKEALRQQLRKDLQTQVDAKAAALQTEVTDRLEAELTGLRQELDQVVNHVTAEALKRKAAQLGQIKELTEDPQSGSLTIVVEV